MKTGNLLYLLILIGLTLTSCGKKGSVLTERIQYDVTITSPERDLEWWVQNLDNNKRVDLVKAVMEAARSGKYKVYDVMTNQELTPEEIEKRGMRRELMTLQRDYPPYEQFDTLVVNKIELSDISRMRFLEEWYLNEDNGKVTKKVLAMCPMLESYTESGELRGHLPLFWISYEKRFPLANK